MFLNKPFRGCHTIEDVQRLQCSIAKRSGWNTIRQKLSMFSRRFLQIFSLFLISLSAFPSSAYVKLFSGKKALRQYFRLLQPLTCTIFLSPCLSCRIVEEISFKWESPTIITIASNICQLINLMKPWWSSFKLEEVQVWFVKCELDICLITKVTRSRRTRQFFQ